MIGLLRRSRLEPNVGLVLKWRWKEIVKYSPKKESESLERTELSWSYVFGVVLGLVLGEIDTRGCSWYSQSQMRYSSGILYSLAVVHDVVLILCLVVSQLYLVKYLLGEVVGTISLACLSFRTHARGGYLGRWTDRFSQESGKAPTCLYLCVAFLVLRIFCV